MFLQVSVGRYRNQSFGFQSVFTASKQDGGILDIFATSTHPEGEGKSSQAEDKAAKQATVKDQKLKRRVKTTGVHKIKFLCYRSYCCMLI